MGAKSILKSHLDCVKPYEFKDIFEISRFLMKLKGQLISKGLFDILNSSKKRTKQI